MSWSIEVPGVVFVAQWVLLLTLAALALILFRQVAHLILLPHTNERRLGLGVGNEAPAFSYRRVDKAADGTLEERQGTFEPRRRTTLLMFTDPLCHSCEKATAALAAARSGALLSGLDVLRVTTAEPAMVRAARRFGVGLDDIVYIAPEVAHETYRTDVAPFFYVIGADGIIRSRGWAEDVAGIERLVGSGRDRGDVAPATVVDGIVGG
jgi:hypothetical protein